MRSTMAQLTHHNEINPRLTENTCDEPEASLMPLEDYQHSHIVSLETATESIKSLFRNLPRDVWIAKNASKKPADDLTSDESAAIHLYTMEVKDQSLYSLINKLLRDRERRKLKPWFSYLKLFITALFKIPPCSAKIVWRGVKADLHSKYHRGEHYTWWAFSSCTLSLEALEQPMYLGTTGERTIFSIEYLNGKNITPHSYYKTEDEILLLPGFYFEVVSKVKAGNDLHIIQLREVIPPFVLLEPPFDIHQSTVTSPMASTIDETINTIYEMNKDNDDMYKLFVALPDPLFDWNSENFFDNHFVIHFVCECSASEMHFACYPAYSVPNPRVFFQIYGHYMKQFMIALARHLFDHQIIDRYHDAQFWSSYNIGLDKMVQVLDVIEYEVATVKKVYDTSKLEELLMSNWSWEYSLCRSVTAEMSVRWVCINHYPVDQLDLISELDDIKEVNLDIFTGSLTFDGEIDSTKMSHICGILARGLRLLRIDLSSLESSASALKQLTNTLIPASIVHVVFSHYRSSTPADSEELQIDNELRSCYGIFASDRQVKYVAMSVSGVYLQKNGEIVHALRSNENLRSLKYELATTSEDMTQMMSMLEKSPILTTLELRNHTLSCESVQRISAMIRLSRTLINLTLSDTKIMDEGMQIIVDAICVNPIMTTLNLRSNDLSDTSASGITRLLQACSSLTNLCLSDNKITVIGARLIFEELQINRTLLYFDISFNNLSVDHARKTMYDNESIASVGELIAKMLLQNTTLCILDIGHIDMSDNDVRPLAEALMKNRTLADLKLSEFNFYLSTMHQPITNVLHWTNSLISLDLSFRILDVMDQQNLGEILRKNDKLRFLALSNCEITDNGLSILAEALRNNHALTCLGLKNNKLTSVSAEALADLLRANSNLTFLNIDSNEIGDDGVKAIARALSEDCSLTSLNIASNNITDIGAAFMIDALKSNKTLLHLDIIDTNNISSNILTSLRSIRRNLQIT